MCNLENTIREDVKLYNKMNFVNYLTCELDARGAIDKDGRPFMTLFYNENVLSWGTMNEINAIVKALIEITLIERGE